VLFKKSKCVCHSLLGLIWYKTSEFVILICKLLLQGSSLCCVFPDGAFALKDVLIFCTGADETPPMWIRTSSEIRVQPQSFQVSSSRQDLCDCVDSSHNSLWLLKLHCWIGIRNVKPPGIWSRASSSFELHFECKTEKVRNILKSPFDRRIDNAKLVFVNHKFSRDLQFRWCCYLEFMCELF